MNFKFRFDPFVESIAVDIRNMKIQCGLLESKKDTLDSWLVRLRRDKNKLHQCCQADYISMSNDVRDRLMGYYSMTRLIRKKIDDIQDEMKQIRVEIERHHHKIADLNNRRDRLLKIREEQVEIFRREQIRLENWEMDESAVVNFLKQREDIDRESQ